MRWGTLAISPGTGGKGVELGGGVDSGREERGHLLPGGGVGTADSNPCSEAGWRDSGHRVPGSKGDRLFLGSVCGNLQVAGGSVEIDFPPSIQQHSDFLNVEGRT